MDAADDESDLTRNGSKRPRLRRVLRAVVVVVVAVLTIVAAYVGLSRSGTPGL